MDRGRRRGVHTFVSDRHGQQASRVETRKLEESITSLEIEGLGGGILMVTRVLRGRMRRMLKGYTVRLRMGVVGGGRTDEQGRMMMMMMLGMF